MVTLSDIQAAAERIAPYIHRTPVSTCRSLDDLLGARVFLKCENLQVGGAFKARGANNAVWQLSAEQAARGVVTHSSGNHAGALSRAARGRGIPAYIVMPRTASPVKMAAVRQYGGQITLCEPTQAAREAATAEIQSATGAELIHPYDDDRIIAGQGTAALELLEQVPDLDLIVTPVGGGGLLAGTAIAVKVVAPHVRVWGAEPAQADDAHTGWLSGERQPQRPPTSIADGLLTSVGERNFPVLRESVDNIVLASDTAILRTTWWLLERTKLVTEPSSAVPLAALIENPEAGHRGLKVGVIISGGNVDLRRLPPADSW